MTSLQSSLAFPEVEEPGLTTTPAVVAEIAAYAALRAKGKNLRRTIGEAMPSLLDYVSPDQRERVSLLGCQAAQVVPWQRPCNHPPFNVKVASFVRIEARRLAPCPICLKLSKRKRSLAAVAPHLEPEWMSERNAPQTFGSVSAHSSKKYWWRHECGEEWEAMVSNRVAGSGCPTCNTKISEIEGHIVAESGALGIVCRMGRLVHSSRRFRIDVMFESPMSNKLALEVDGWPYHALPQEVAADLEVNRLCETLKIPLLRLRHPRLGALAPGDIVYEEADTNLAIVKRVLSRLVETVTDEVVRRRVQHYLDHALTWVAPDVARNILTAAIRVKEGDRSVREANPVIADCFDRCRAENYTNASEVRANATYERLFSCGQEGHPPISMPVDQAVKLKRGLNCPQCKPLLKYADPVFFQGIEEATRAGFNAHVDIEQLKPGSGAYVDWCCQSCSRLNKKTEVRERTRGRGRCVCEDLALLIYSAPELATRITNVVDVGLVSLGSHAAVSFKCNGTRDGQRHLECEQTVVRTAKNAYAAFKRNGTLPICDKCFSLIRARNFELDVEKG